MTLGGHLDAGKVSSRPCEYFDVGLIPVARLEDPVKWCSVCEPGLVLTFGDLWRSNLPDFIHILLRGVYIEVGADCVRFSARSEKVGCFGQLDRQLWARSNFQHF